MHFVLNVLIFFGKFMLHSAHGGVATQIRCGGIFNNHVSLLQTVNRMSQ